MKITQILLYNQLRFDYLHNNIDSVLYIHHTGKIKFQGADLRLNPLSKIIDYAGGKQMIADLQSQGYQAEFREDSHFFSGLLGYAQDHDIEKFVVVQPVEDYVYKNFLTIQQQLQKKGIQLEFIADTQSFFLSHDAFRSQYSKAPIMEYFCRFMRKKENILIEPDGTPTGGAWNYDKQNRKFDKKHQKTWNFSLKENSFVTQAQKKYPSTYTDTWFQPTHRAEALELLDYFIEHHLDHFGELEDAMYEDDPFVHHSLLSTSINFGFLSPREVVQRVAAADTAINNKEGCIRQILGWREYMYHFFHCYKETIYEENFFNHTRPLPDYFWKNPSQCPIKPLRIALENVHRYGSCHHIQRLMVIGNFALLANLDPHELNRWFFEYYTDAFEWVVTPNVLAMSQYADGGKLATKPYVSSANYLHKMSDYYRNSPHNPKEKYTDDACPFNYLYWCFVDDNKETFKKGRQQFVLKNLEKVDIQKCQELKQKFLDECL